MVTEKIKGVKEQFTHSEHPKPCISSASFMWMWPVFTARTTNYDAGEIMKTKCVIQDYQDEDRLAIDSVVLAA